ncbi:MAG: hypothetical protein DCC68_17385 [Planctomycetota bacterium]|nr:MAG: hypothetical protein DCC68_17385 [Planctomycetota bacterium]
MKTLCFIATTLMLTFALVGCTKESPKGGPGAAEAERNSNAASDADERTFTLKVPSITTTVEQGGRDEVTLAIDRGDQFKEDVTLKFQAPAGVKVTPAETAIKSGAEETKVTIEAAPDAPPGDTHIEVTAVPQTGQSVSQKMPISVTKAS